MRISTAIIIDMSICTGLIFFSLHINSTISSLFFYNDCVARPIEDFLDEGNEFSYMWWGEQYGHGAWSGYHWHFEESGLLRITSISGEIAKGTIEGERKVVDEDRTKVSKFYGVFVYFVSNNTLMERYIIAYEDRVVTSRRYMHGSWFYMPYDDPEVAIYNETFINSGVRTILVNNVFIELWVFSRKYQNFEYVEDNIRFYGSLSEKYCFDSKAKVLVYYELLMKDMWNKAHTIGWDYYEYFKLKSINIGLSVSIPKSMYLIYYLVVFLLGMKTSIFLFVFAYVAYVLDKKITVRKFQKVVREIEELQMKHTVRRLEQYEPELTFTGWLKPGFVVFKTASGSHVLANLGGGKDHALSPLNYKYLEKMLKFSKLTDYEIDRLRILNLKTKAIIFSDKPPCSDSVFFRKLRLVSIYEYMDISGMLRKHNLEAKKILKFAYEISSYRKILTDKYGQAYINPPNNVYRALEIYLRSRSNEVLLIGDDDLLSLILAFFGCNVSVIDVDDYTLRLIYFLAGKYGLRHRIRLYLHDIRLPFDLGRRFYAVHIDPGYSIDGMLLFLSRALQNLELGGHLFVSWLGKWVHKDVLNLAFRHFGLLLEGMSPFYLKYLIPIPGYYAHHSYKYSVSTYYVGPTIKVVNLKSRFFICRYVGKYGYVVKSDKYYSGVLY